MQTYKVSLFALPLSALPLVLVTSFCGQDSSSSDPAPRHDSDASTKDVATEHSGGSGGSPSKDAGKDPCATLHCSPGWSCAAGQCVRGDGGPDSATAGSGGKDAGEDTSQPDMGPTCEQERCDGIDNDCDGETDEENICVGCSDGERDELSDQGRWPRIAACKGDFGWMSLRTDRTGTPCGDDIDQGCAAPEDLCAGGWHICMRNGQAEDMRFALTADECRGLDQTYVAATNNCSNPASENPASTSCNMTEPYDCYPSGWCSAPVACGPTDTSHCAHAVWPGQTRIFGLHAGLTDNKGCGHIASGVSYNAGTLVGVLCCRD